MVDGTRECGGKQRVHGRGALRLVGVGVVVGIEAPDAQKVDDLHVALFVGAYERAHHLLFLVVGVGDVEVERDARLACLSADVHEAVYSGGGVREVGSGVDVVERYAGYGVDGLQVEVGSVGLAVEGYGAVGRELEVLADDLL